MKAIITDSGDPSTGIPATTYDVDCPFEKDEVDNYDLWYFKYELNELYSDFSQRRVEIMYDYEVKEIEDRILKDMEG